MRACVCLWCSGWFVTTLPDTDFVAKLTDVFPDGTSMLIQVWLLQQLTSCVSNCLCRLEVHDIVLVWCGLMVV